MIDEPEDVLLAREVLERKTGPEARPFARQLARAVIRWWESAMFWRDQAGALGPALLRANEELAELRVAAKTLSDASTHCRSCRDCGDGPCCDECGAEAASTAVDRLMQPYGPPARERPETCDACKLPIPDQSFYCTCVEPRFSS